MQKLLSLLTIVGLLLWSSPSLVIAQTPSRGNSGTAPKAFLPLIRSATAAPLADEEDTGAGLQSTGIGRELLVATPRGASQQAVPNRVTALKLASPVTASDGAVQQRLSKALTGTTGRRQVVVQLSELSVVQRVLTDLTASSVAAQQAQVAVVQRQQAAVLSAALQLDAGANLLGQVNKALNAIMLDVDATVLPALAAHPAVLSIRPVMNYSLALSETVPYIGGKAVQALGYDGKGVSVAVLDSGIDYTHANLGGPGTLAAYKAAYGTSITDTLNTTLDGLFPTARVVGGYDFVGELWGSEGGAVPAPDPDPIDLEGHGTHVADIIGGVRGVAPAADLYAVKVCSAISTSCSGTALLQGMDFALDPNGDDEISDAVDVINLSLGSDYGTAEDDDLTRAVEFASAYGVIVVAAAGNGGDKPYIHGTPAAAPSAIAVAQTNVPSAVQPVMAVQAPASIAGNYEAVFQPWSVAPTAAIEGPVQYGDGVTGNRHGCAPFTPGSLTGKIVLVDRGACNFTAKLVNISQGGGLAGLIGLITPGDPFNGGDGGDRPIAIPGYMISQATANKLKNELANGVVLRFDPASELPLVMHMVGSSSRGPVSSNLLKPDIGAPGASVSAIAGSGAGEGAFGGTSGATPMVAGAAALLRQAYPTRSGAEIKALLMNTAETNIMNRAALFGGDLAPITRIGGGEVRVERAVAAPAAAWDADAQTGSLSFSFHDVTDELTLQRLVNVRNYSDRDLTYQIKPTFRFANDAVTHAVTITAPSELFVPAGSDAQFEVELEVAGKSLHPWSMNSGAQGANPAPLTLHEYDGYLQLAEAGGGSAIHLAWQILPRQAGDVSLKPHSSYVQVRNGGVNTTTVESYSLIGVSSNLPQGGPGDNNPIPDLRYVGYATYPAPAGYCSEAESFVLAFAINTWERQVHANSPAEFDVYIDVDQDGEFDYDVFNFDRSLAGNRTDGRNVTWVGDLKSGQAVSYFAVDHETNSANTVLLLCGEQIGLNASNFLDPMNIAVVAFDAFYRGLATDVLQGITIAPAGEQYVGVFDGGGGAELGPDQKDKLRILDQGQLTNNTESGLLLLFRDGAAINREAGTVVILP